MMSVDEKTYSIPSETLKVITKCDPTVKPEDLKFKDIDELWCYLKRLELSLDIRMQSKTDLLKHMELMHDYNDMKDTAQLVLGKMADLLHISVSEAHEKFDLQSDEL